MGLGEIGALDGEHVDEDGSGSLEEHVEWGCVFEDPAFCEELGAEIEGELCCSLPEGRGATGWVGDEGDAWMTEQERFGRCGWTQDFTGDEETFGDEFCGEGSFEESEHVRSVGICYGTKCSV